MLEEFKKFAMRGNVVDLAVGVIIGAAFGKIVEFDGRRHLHADRRRGHRWPRLFELFAQLTEVKVAAGTSLADAKKRARCSPGAISRPS